MYLGKRDIDQSLKMVGTRRPVLQAALTTLGPLLKRREEAVELLREKTRGAQLPEFLPSLASTGMPLLCDWGLDGLGELAAEAARAMLPTIFGTGKADLPAERLEKIFMAPENTPLREGMLQGLLRGDDADMEGYSEKLDIPQPILKFVAEFVFSPLLRALAENYAKDGEFPWDVEGAWTEGYCPVCGQYPVIAWLDRPEVDIKNSFLAGGGGKKHFHCDLCGVNWKFKRLTCPSCGKEGEGIMELLRETGKSAERIDWCVQCRTYCPAVDLREMDCTPNMDVMALAMIPLNMAAHEKNLAPLKQSLWNNF